MRLRPAPPVLPAHFYVRPIPPGDAGRAIRERGSVKEDPPPCERCGRPWESSLHIRRS